MRRIDRCIHLLLAVVAVGCGTGIESHRAVTDRDVERITAAMDRQQPPATLTAFVDSLPAWQTGKRFYVTDDQARLLFSHSPDYDLDTIRLGGRTVTYVGYDTGSVLDNRETVNIKLSDGHDTFVYRTEKTLPEFTSSFSIPLLIDLDLVDHVGRQITGHDYYILTPIWYDRTSGQMKQGRKFVPVHIDSVQPGNKVLPLRVLFTAGDTDEQAMLWMSTSGVIRNRDFDALLTTVNPRSRHPEIGDAHWQLIVEGRVTDGMTKDECRLALGTPKRITSVPDQMGLREYWYYDGGNRLYFVDGLLTQPSLRK